MLATAKIRTFPLLLNDLELILCYAESALHKMSTSVFVPFATGLKNLTDNRPLFIWMSLIEIHWIGNGTIFIDHWNLNDFIGDPSMYIRIVHRYSLTHSEVKLTSRESYWPQKTGIQHSVCLVLITSQVYFGGCIFTENFFKVFEQNVNFDHNSWQFEWGLI